jgi:uncharacterized membrane protein YhiD involved in acid resistance
MADPSQDPRRKAERDARSAGRWATAGMWLSGCGLALWAIPILLGIVAVVWIFLALRPH